MSRTTILYKDIAPGAEEDAAITTASAMPGSDPSKLPAGVTLPPIISGQWNAWGLDGTYQPIDGQPIAFWSSQLSGEGCAFADPPVITVDFDRQYSSTGVTLVFDPATGDYCPAVSVKWYQGQTLKAEADFAPNASTFFCQKNVTSYDKVVITLIKTRHPYRRARLNRILFGVHRSFGMTEIRKASLINSMDLLSSELPVSTLKWTLDSREDVDFMFQLKQPVEVRNGDSLIGVYYIDGSARKSASLYDIDCYDAFGVLDESPFAGGVYSGKSARTLLTEILGGDFELDCTASDTDLTGAILPCTRREAAQQVLFAWGVCACTDGTEKVRVFTSPEQPKAIDQDHTFTGASVETAAIVTQVRVTAHTYTQDAGGTVEIGGVKYSDTQTVCTVTNPDVTATDKQNVVEVTGATLVSPSIAQAAAQRVYDHYARRNTHKAKIVWSGECLGDCVTVPNAWGGTVTGNIVRMEVGLSNTVAASCETVGV